MSQHDYVIDNQDGASFRGDINQALAAIASNNSGAAEPSTTYAFMWWIDTANGLLKQRNSTNDAWITLATIGKTLTPTDSKALAKAWVNFNGTGTVAIRSSFNVTSITDNGVGAYTVNFATAMEDTNYAVLATSGDGASTNYRVVQVSDVTAPTTTAVRLQTLTQNSGNPQATDHSRVSVAIFD